MYNVKGPSKIVAKSTRRGISQNIDTLRDHVKNKSLDCNDNGITNGPKPIFNNVSKRNLSNYIRRQSITPQHEEIIKFVHDSWTLACSEMDQNSSTSTNDQCIVYYEDKPTNVVLQNFKPFDLESWWGKRLYTIITNSVNKN